MRALVVIMVGMMLVGCGKEDNENSEKKETSTQSSQSSTQSSQSSTQPSRSSTQPSRSSTQPSRSSTRSENQAKTYTLKFSTKKNVEISQIKEMPKNSGKFTYKWRHVCGVCGWKNNSTNSATATGGNGGFQKGFSCFDCFKAKRPGHNTGPAHITQIKWSIAQK